MCACALHLSIWPFTHSPNQRRCDAAGRGAGPALLIPHTHTPSSNPHRRQMLQDEEQGRALLIPLMRSLGNIAAGGGSTAAAQLLSPDAAPALQALVTCAGVRSSPLCAKL